MKINKDLFLEKTNLASKFISLRVSSSGVLQGVNLKKEKENLYFYSTNLNFYYKGVLKAEEKESFNIVIDPKKISEFLSLLPPGEADFIIKEKSLVISRDKIKGEFPFVLSEEFPFIKTNTTKKQKINIKTLKKIFSLISFSASNDDSRPVLTGINFNTIDELTHIVATDGFRLSLYMIKEKLPFSSVIIPSFFLEEILKLSNKKDEIDFSYEEKEKVLTFYLDEGEFSTRLIEGEYPPYEKVIPKEVQTEVVVDREDFLRNIKIVSVFAKDFSNIVLLNIDKNSIKITPKTSTKDEDFSVQEAETKGEPIKIAFNLKFLIDFLSRAGSDKIKIEFLRPESPTVFKMINNDDFLHIIMPIRVQE